MTRRTLLGLLVNGIGAVVTVVVGIPAMITALSPVIRRDPTARWEPVGRAEAFAVGSTTRAAVEVPRQDPAQALREKGVYVWRPSEKEFVVFSRNCTHLSCPVLFTPGSSWFYCPCHGGIFAQDGTAMRGPTNRPLYRYALRVRNGMIEIDLNSLPPMT